MEESHSDLNFEIILINDGSDDGSWEEIQEVSTNEEEFELEFSRGETLTKLVVISNNLNFKIF